MHAYRTYLYTFCAVLVILGASFALAQDNALKFKLKPDATGKLCFNCHAAFKEKMSKPFVHTPLKKGECTGCHNPHTSTHGKLLSADNGGVCYRCHTTVVPSGAKSVHKVVGEGSCMKCHDPHSAPNKENLLKGGNELCFECHKEMGATLSKVKYRHMPVAQGCLNCHDPHASAKNPYLLKSDIIPLCVGCHKTDRPMFAKKHMNYPVANARCTGCHDPHGSDNPGILYNTVHKPVATRMCNQCHEEATSPNPLATKKTGTDLCRGCHNDMVNTTFGLNRVHGPLLSKQGLPQLPQPPRGQAEGHPAPAHGGALQQLPRGQHEASGKGRVNPRAGQERPVHGVPRSPLIQLPLPDQEVAGYRALRRLPRLGAPLDPPHRREVPGSAQQEHPDPVRELPRRPRDRVQEDALLSQDQRPLRPVPRTVQEVIPWQKRS
uniref:cytochrome c3 family protein n=1 Tax=Geobacter sulfurreducens TaxID=35554 RepID=UPI000022E9D9